MKLTIIPTPIGNLGDITLRALAALQNFDLLFCEDTRVTGRLLKHHEVSCRLMSYHAHNEHKKLDEFINIIKSHNHVGLCSDAGMPGISDPGFLLIRACIKENIKIEVLPGPSAAITALVGSGLPCDRYHFEGFLPVKKGRQTRLKYLNTLEDTIVFYESPYKILKTLNDLSETFGPDCQACVARELTKIHEEFLRGTLSDIHKTLSERPSIKGEIVLVVSGVKSDRQ